MFSRIHFGIENYLEKNGMETVFPRFTDQLRKDFLAQIWQSKEFKADVPKYPYVVNWLFDKMESIIDVYFEFMTDNPDLPLFLVNELVYNPKRCQYVKELFITNEYRIKFFDKLCNLVNDAIARGQIREIDPVDLLENIISLIVMSFASVPIYAELTEKDGSEEKEMLMRREKEIKTLIRNGLRP